MDINGRSGKVSSGLTNKKILEEGLENHVPINHNRDGIHTIFDTLMGRSKLRLTKMAGIFDCQEVQRSKHHFD